MQGAIRFDIAGLVWFFTRAPEVEPIPAPVDDRPPLETVAPAKSATERGDTAREIIAELQAGEDGIDYGEAYAQASRFQADGKLADAQLLYFFAARGGFAPAAFDLAAIYDPNHFVPGSTLVEEPDPFQAYRWYQVAADGGNDDAAARLDELKSWADQAAADGDASAERLLLQWEN